MLLIDDEIDLAWVDGVLSTNPETDIKEHARLIAKAQLKNVADNLPENPYNISTEYDYHEGVEHYRNLLRQFLLDEVN